MAFLLQGNARSISFHGEQAKALSTPSSPGLLGKPRVRRSTTVPPPRMPSLEAQPTTRMGDAPIRTPFPQRIATPIPGLREARSPYHVSPLAPPLPLSPLRAPMDSYSDQDPTTALGNHDADVMPGGRIPAKPVPAAGRPIPHFRGAPVPPLPAPPSVVVASDTGSQRVTSRPSAAWLGWLAASLVLGLASYHLSPAVFAKVAPASVAVHAR